LIRGCCPVCFYDCYSHTAFLSLAAEVLERPEKELFAPGLSTLALFCLTLRAPLRFIKPALAGTLTTVNKLSCDADKNRSGNAYNCGGDCV